VVQRPATRTKSSDAGCCSPQIRLSAGLEVGQVIRDLERNGKQDFESGKVGRTVYSRSGPNMAPHRPRRIFDGRQCSNCGAKGGRIGKS
jgi:hypothetical protein